MKHFRIRIAPRYRAPLELEAVETKRSMDSVSQAALELLFSLPKKERRNAIYKQPVKTKGKPL